MGDCPECEIRRMTQGSTEARWRELLERSERAEAEAAKWRSQADALAKALEHVAENDRTRYEHHEARPSDGKKPREVGGGSIWLTPKEIARSALAKYREGRHG